MDHYIDIHLRPDPEFAEHQLMQALYAKLHRALVQLGGDDIGVSFPTFKEAPPALGAHLRLHGRASSLDSLMDSGWLAGMRDHLQVSIVQPVPAAVRHRRVGRVQAKSNPERLRRRAMRRHGIDAEAARQRIPDDAAETLRLPFVQMGSRSTGQSSFPLFIQHGPIQTEPVAGNFNRYGLSKESTIPWF